MDEAEGEETLLSPNTNRPVTDVRDIVIFWCDLCQLKMTSVYVAIQHLTGKNHVQKVALRNENPKSRNILKRKQLPTHMNRNVVKRSNDHPSTSASSNQKERLITGRWQGLDSTNYHGQQWQGVDSTNYPGHGRHGVDSTNYHWHAGRGRSRGNTRGGYAARGHNNASIRHMHAGRGRGAGRGMPNIEQNWNNQVGNILVRKTVLPDIVRENVDLSKVKHFDKGQSNNFRLPSAANQFTPIQPIYNPPFSGVQQPIHSNFQGNLRFVHVQPQFHGNFPPVRHTQYY